MLVFETTGISSPAWVPAIRKKRIKQKKLFGGFGGQNLPSLLIRIIVSIY